MIYHFLLQVFCLFSLPLSVQSASTATSFSPYSLFQSAFDATWSSYWNYQQNSWSEKGCPNTDFLTPVLWDLVTAAGAAVFTNNPYFLSLITNQLNAYKNSDNGGFSATTTNKTDLYSDDNAQAIWVYLDAYALSGKKDYLNAAEGMMSYIQLQWVSNGGGVRWNHDGHYLASIAQTESALAAVRLYKVTKNDVYLQFSKNCINWCLEHLQDPSDHLFYDGLDISTGNLNKGKLSYTIGTAISTFAHLYTIDNDQKWLTLAQQVIKASATGTGALYSSNGYWNNPLEYLHLLFQGLADYTTLVTPKSGSDVQLLLNIKKEVWKNAQYISQYYQDGNSGYYYDIMFAAPTGIVSKFNDVFKATGSSYSTSSPSKPCSDGKTYSSLLINGAAARIFYHTWRV